MTGRPPVLAVLAMLCAACGSRDRVAAGDGSGSAAGPGSVGSAGQPGTGALRLPGVVVDGAGAPIAGVTITASTDAAAADATRSPPAVVAVAGADGRFALLGVEPGRYRLVIEGAEIFTAELRAVPVPSDDVRIVVARRVAITGRVVDGREPMSGAAVEIAGDAIAGRRAATTGPDGGFAFDPLPEGTYQVWAWQGDLAARTQRVVRLGAGPFAPVALAVEPATIVVGRVVDRDGGAGVAAAVELRSIDRTDGGGEASRYARSTADGAFRVEGLPHGRWTADAWSPGWVTAGTVDFEAARGVPEVELVAGGVITGVVTDEAGQPIAGARVRATAAGQGGATYAEDDAVERLRRYSGLAIARAVAATPAAPRTAGAGAGTDPRFVPRGELGVLLGPIPFPPPPGAGASRQAAIVDAALHGVSFDPADPAPLPVDPDRASTWTTGADGRFRITGVARGTITVFATAPGRAEGASTPITAGPGRDARDVAIALVPGATLVGAVTDQHGAAVGGASVAAAPKGSTDPRRRVDTVTDATGAYRLGPLSGAVTVTVDAYAHADARAEVELPVTGESRHDVVLAVDDAVLTGTVTDPAGAPVRGATVTIAAGPAAGRSAVTGDTGFRIERLPPGAITVRVDHPDFPPHQLDATTLTTATLVLPWGGGVDGAISDHHTSAPLGGIALTAVGPGGARAETSSTATGTFELRALVPGEWRLVIARPGYLRLDRTVDVPAADRTGVTTLHDLALELERGALLAGTARDRRGAPVANATITARRATGDGPTLTTRTDADGQFRLRDAPSGALVLRATKSTLSGTLDVLAAPGDEQLSLVLELR